MDLLTYDDIAKETGVNVNTLHQWRHRGKMPEPTVDKNRPLWARKEIQKWMQQNSHMRPTS